MVRKQTIQQHLESVFKDYSTKDDIKRLSSINVFVKTGIFRTSRLFTKK